MKTILLSLALLGSTTVALAQNPNRPGPRHERPDPESVAKLLLSNHDIDGNGVLSATEFADAMKAHREAMRAAGRGPEARPRPGPKADEDTGKRGPRGEGQPGRMAKRLNEAFADADADQSGGLNATEIASALEAMRPPREGGRGPRPE